MTDTTTALRPLPTAPGWYECGPAMKPIVLFTDGDGAFRTTPDSESAISEPWRLAPFRRLVFADEVGVPRTERDSFSDCPNQPPNHPHEEHG